MSRVHSKHRSGLWGRWLGRPGIPAFSRVDGHVQHGVFVLGGGEELGFAIDTLETGGQVTLDSDMILWKNHQAEHVRPALGKGRFYQHFHHSPA